MRQIVRSQKRHRSYQRTAAAHWHNQLLPLRLQIGPTRHGGNDTDIEFAQYRRWRSQPAGRIVIASDHDNVHHWMLPSCCC